MRAVGRVAAVLLITVPTNVQGQALSMGRATQSPARGEHLEPTSTIGDLLHHPAFAGFARLLLPWDDRDYDERMPLTRMGSLLPYHTHVDPQTVTNGLNHLVDDAAPGDTVFYRFYSETQIEQEPSRGNHLDAIKFWEAR